MVYEWRGDIDCTEGHIVTFSLTNIRSNVLIREMNVPVIPARAGPYMFAVQMVRLR